MGQSFFFCSATVRVQLVRPRFFSPYFRMMGSHCKSELLGIHSLLAEVKPVKYRSICQAQIALPTCSQFSALVCTLRDYTISKENTTWNHKLEIERLIDRQIDRYLQFIFHLLRVYIFTHYINYKHIIIYMQCYIYCI